MGPWILIGIGIAIGFFVGKSIADESERRKLADKEQEFQQLQERKEGEFALHQDQREQSFSQFQDQKENTFRILVEEARTFSKELQHGMLRGRRWLANAFAEFIETRDMDVECWLAVKPHPAMKASEQVKEVRIKRRELVQQLKLLEYQLASYEEYFPFLVEYRDAILDESIDLRKEALDELEEADPALSRGFLTKEEYEKLSTTEKFQLALDRYWKKQKSQHEIGRVYERFLGYLYELDGWRVTYHGILKGREDFGRDLICLKGDEVHIVQCKCWAKRKVIREKHVFQLFGTTVLFKLGELELRNSTQERQGILFDSASRVTPVFAATTDLSTEAIAVAKYLNVSIRNERLHRYPMVKCNINPTTQERIYHLPFDQQYDKVVIGNIEGEFYANSIAEAEQAGFRRAFRWRGNEGKKEN